MARKPLWQEVAACQKRAIPLFDELEQARRGNDHVRGLKAVSKIAEIYHTLSRLEGRVARSWGTEADEYRFLKDALDLLRRGEDASADVIKLRLIDTNRMGPSRRSASGGA